MPGEGLVAVCYRALRAFEQAAEQAVSRIRGVVDARREVEAGEWSDAAVGRIRLVLRRLEDAGKALDDGSLANSVVEAVREGLKALDEERHSGDPLAATTREVPGRLEAADLPLPVLTRALDEIRMSQTAGREAAGVLLERLRVVADLPWTARASERVDIEAAMAELEAAHAGRAALKARVRRFLATRRLTSTPWTVEGRSHDDRSRRGDGSAPVALRRLVVRPARSATRTPILCFAGPPGGGKTTLAMLIARALRRPGVIVALGGVWDESAIRGLPISFRSPEAGRIVLGLQEARVRNPVMILDEIDKVGGGATTNFGDPSAALLEVLDPAQNTHFRDAYVEAPIDLSEVLFIATANDLAKIPAPLRDRGDHRGARVHGRRKGRHRAAHPVARAGRGQRVERRRLLDPDPGGDVSGAAGGGVRRVAGPQAADRGPARWGAGGHDAAGGRSRGEPVRAADGGRGRGDGCGDPGSGAGPYL